MATAERSRRPRATRAGEILVGLAVAACLLVVYLTATRQWVHGSEAGSWVFLYYADFSAKPVLVLLLVLPTALALTGWTLSTVERHEWLTLAVWFAAAFALQIGLRWLYVVGMQELVESEVANSFYGVTQTHAPRVLLRSFEALAESLPLHLQTNLLGKALFYYVLELFTSSPRILGHLVVLVSNVGGLLLYSIVKDLFADRRAALFAAILYFFVPGKLFFFPLLNTVTPVPILLCLLLHQRFLRSGRRRYALLLGVCLYLTTFFEPIPLVMGLLFLAFLVAAVRQGRIGWAAVGQLVLYTGATFALAFCSMLVLFHYDLARDLARCFWVQLDYHRIDGRSYGVWIRQNLIDFMTSTGICQFVLSFLTLPWLLRRGAERAGNGSSSGPLHPAALVGGSLVLILAFLNFVVCTRGESQRLWIFLACFFQIVPAYFCARSPSAVRFGAVLAATILYDAVTISMVGFVLP